MSFLINKRNTIFIAFLMVLPIGAMSNNLHGSKRGFFAGLIAHLRVFKKEVFQNVKKDPKQLFDDIGFQLQQGSQQEKILRTQYPNQVKLIYDSHWSLRSFFHVFIGEYVSHEQADIRNKYLLLINNNKNIRKQPLSVIHNKIKENENLSDQDVEQLKIKGTYCSKGIMKGLHTVDAFNSLKKSMELQNDFNIDGTLVDLDEDNYVSGKCYSDSCVPFNGSLIPGIKTIWPDAWTIIDVLDVTKKAIDNSEISFEGKPVDIKFTTKKNGIELTFHIYVSKENGQFVVQTAYVEPDVIQLAKLDLSKKKKSKSDGKMLNPNECLVVQDDVVFRLCGIDREDSVTKLKKAIKAMQNKTIFCEKCTKTCSHDNHRSLPMCRGCFIKKIKKVTECCILFRQNFSNKLNILLGIFDDKDKHDTYKNFVQSLNSTSSISSNIGIDLSKLSLTSKSSTKLSNNNK